MTDASGTRLNRRAPDRDTAGDSRALPPRAVAAPAWPGTDRSRRAAGSPSQPPHGRRSV